MDCVIERRFLMAFKWYFQIFLSIPDLMHEFRHPNIIEISYQEKYTSLPFNLQKPYKAQVQITRIHNNKFKVDFRLISGNNKRFVRTFQKIQVSRHDDIFVLFFK